MTGKIIYDMSHEDYHSRTEVSKGNLDLLNRSPAHLLAKLEGHETPPTKAMAIGTATHVGILEPDYFNSRYVIRPPGIDGRTKAGKEELARLKADGREVLDYETYELIMRMRDSVMEHPIGSGLLSDGVAEATGLWTDEETGTACRCRPDWVYDNAVVVDLKTTENASLHAVQKSIANWRYHVQDAFYTDGLTACGIEVEHFLFLFVEKHPPYPVRIVELDEEAKRAGRAIYRNNLRRYTECKSTGDWPDIQT